MAKNQLGKQLLGMAGVGGVAMYASLPTLTKIGLALL